MWIQKTNVGVKRVLFILFLILAYFYFNFGKVVEYRIFITLILVAYACFVAYRMYDRGAIIRIKSFFIGQIQYEIQKIIMFKPSQTSKNAIIVIPSTCILSSIPISKKGKWTYFSCIPKLLKDHHINLALVLGAGGGAVPYMLLRDKLCSTVDAVEKHARMISIAKQYMLPRPLPRGLHLICDDAKEYVAKTTTLYDFIFVDIFDGTFIKLSDDKHFIKHIPRLLNDNGLLMVNFGFSDYMNMSVISKEYVANVPNFTLYYIQHGIIGINRKKLSIS